MLSSAPVQRRVPSTVGPALPACAARLQMANTLRTSLVVFTRKGNMPALLSHYRRAAGAERQQGGLAWPAVLRTPPGLPAAAAPTPAI